jgi:ubiquinone biosynthesis protein UbiJ
LRALAHIGDKRLAGELGEEGVVTTVSDIPLRQRIVQLIDASKHDPSPDPAVLAGAILSAIRVPTRKMAEGGDALCGDYGCGEHRMISIFTAMIDVAVEE